MDKGIKTPEERNIRWTKKSIVLQDKFQKNASVRPIYERCWQRIYDFFLSLPQFVGQPNDDCHEENKQNTSNNHRHIFWNDWTKILQIFFFVWSASIEIPSFIWHISKARSMQSAIAQNKFTNLKSHTRSPSPFVVSFLHSCTVTGSLGGPGTRELRSSANARIDTFTSKGSVGHEGTEMFAVFVTLLVFTLLLCSGHSKRICVVHQWTKFTLFFTSRKSQNICAQFG